VIVAGVMLEVLVASFNDWILKINNVENEKAVLLGHDKRGFYILEMVSTLRFAMNNNILW